MSQTARETFMAEEAGIDRETGSIELATEFATVLEDFLDQEVADRQGEAVGTLECYWESMGNGLVFLGIRLNGRDGIRVVPGRRSQVDERCACIRLPLDADEIAGAPCCDSGADLDASVERAACEHFRGGCKLQVCGKSS